MATLPPQKQPVPMNVEVDMAGEDSFGEEEEYEPIDYNNFIPKKPSSQRSTTKASNKRTRRGIENERPSKKARITRNIERVHYEGMDEDSPVTAVPPVTSDSIIKSMKQSKDYESRASTKIVGLSASASSSTNDKSKKTKTMRKKRTRSNKRNTEDSISTTMLIAQKTTQSTMHAKVPLTAEEKFLQQQYKQIEKFLAQHKKRSKHKDIRNSLMDAATAAMSSDLKRANASSIIVEPGQATASGGGGAVPGSTSTVDDCFMSSFTETFIKPSTQYITQKNLSSSHKRNIDVDAYFGGGASGGASGGGGDTLGGGGGVIDSDSSNKPLTHQQRIELNQKRALEILSKTGGACNIGNSNRNNNNNNNNNNKESHRSNRAATGTTKTLKRSKLRKLPVAQKNLNSGGVGGVGDLPPVSSLPTDTSMSHGDYNLNDADTDMMHVHHDDDDDDDINTAVNKTDATAIDNNSNNNNNTTDVTPSSGNSSALNTTDEHDLNSGFGDGLPSHDETGNADATTLNLQKFELARKAAMDTTNAIDDEEHLEKCNVYVGGLHPDCDNSMLRKFFQHCGDVKQIRLDWRKKGFGFVHYATHEQAREAIEDMDGRLIMGQPIKCRWAKNKNKMRERELLRAAEKENPKSAGVGGDNGESESTAAAQTSNSNSNDPNANTGSTTANMMSNMHVNNNLPPPPLHAQNHKNLGNETVSTSSMGFLSRGIARKPSQPPALIKAKKSALNDDDDTGDGVVNNNESGEIEYW